MVSQRAWVVFLLGCCLTRPSPARAAETDYLPRSVAWNGLTQLVEIAQRKGIRVTLLEQLDWRTLPAQSTIFFVYPKAVPRTEDVLSYLAAGGRILVADDFGAARPLLAALGIQRVSGIAIRGAPTFRDNPQLPIATDGPNRHPLNAGVSRLITNHPAFFRSQRHTIFGFGEGDKQLVVEGTWEKGRFVALADPSVLINSMLAAFPQNRTFAENLVQYLSPDHGDQVFLVTGPLRYQGRPAPATSASARFSATQTFLTEYNDFLGQLNGFALTQGSLRALAFVLAGLSSVVLLLMLPFPGRPLGGHWLRPATGRGWQPSLPTRTIAPGTSANSPAGSSGGAGHPAATLKEELEHLLTRHLEASSPVFTMHPDWLLQRVRQQAGDQAAAALTQLLRSLQHVPDAAEVKGHRIGRGNGPKRLAETYRRAQRVLDLLEIPHTLAWSPRSDDDTDT